MRVALFATCIADLLEPEIAVATARVLQRAGHEVVFPEGQTCCGQPAFNSGHDDAAREVLSTTVDALAADDCDVIVCPSGSCTTMIRQHAEHLLGESRALANVAPRVMELTEFLRQHGGDLSGVAPEGPIAYHQSCHMLRVLGLSTEPGAALERLEGVEKHEWDAERCCGFGVTFSVLEPEVSVAMADEKLASLDGARILCGADAACLMHLRGRLTRLGSPIEVRHIAEVLEEGTRSA